MKPKGVGLSLRGGQKEMEVGNTIQARDYKGVGNFQFTNGASVNGKIRRLTPTECERLQGFPDGWTKDISDSQRYKCYGNAVTVNVIEAIMKRVYDSHK